MKYINYETLAALEKKLLTQFLNDNGELLTSHTTTIDVIHSMINIMLHGDTPKTPEHLIAENTLKKYKILVEEDE